jgi:DNA processing protein
VEDILYWIWLSRVFFYGSWKPKELIRLFETPERVYQLDESRLKETGFLTEKEVASCKRLSVSDMKAIAEECYQKGITILTYDSKEYPQRLRNIYAPPMVLYLKGSVAGLDAEPAVTVVGTREASDYGLSVTGNLCYELSKCGMTIISGCAVGIDSYAHLGALKAKGRTIGVLGCGLDVDYPRKNKELKEKILEQGALVSEYPPGTQPAGKHFPVRNRILSALSLGVLVTEAPMKSGALLTAEHALEQGKDLFCVPPHDIYDPAYLGVAKYLRDGAIPVFSAEDILFEYLFDYPHKLNADLILEKYLSGRRKLQRKPRIPEKKKPLKWEEEASHKKEAQTSLQQEESPRKESEEPLEGALKTVYDALNGEYPQYIDEIAGAVELSFPQIQSSLTQLELMGLVVSYPGSRYSRK